MGIKDAINKSVLLVSPGNDQQDAFNDSLKTNNKFTDRSLRKYLRLAWYEMFGIEGSEKLQDYVNPRSTEQTTTRTVTITQNHQYENQEQAHYESAVETYNERITKKYKHNKAVVNAPNTSFFGITEWWSDKKWWGKPFAVIFIPLTTAVNVVRLVAEFIPYTVEQFCRFSLLKLRYSLNSENQEGIIHIDPTFNLQKKLKRVLYYGLAAPLLLLPLGIGYYSFKAVRLLARTVTAPVESFNAARKTHWTLAAISGLVSLSAFVFIAAYAAPVAAKALAVKTKLTAKIFPTIKAALKSWSTWLRPGVIYAGASLVRSISSRLFGRARQNKRDAGRATKKLDSSTVVKANVVQTQTYLVPQQALKAHLQTTLNLIVKCISNNVDKTQALRKTFSAYLDIVQNQYYSVNSESVATMILGSNSPLSKQHEAKAKLYFNDHVKDYCVSLTKDDLAFGLKAAYFLQKLKSQFTGPEQRKIDELFTKDGFDISQQFEYFQEKLTTRLQKKKQPTQSSNSSGFFNGRTAGKRATKSALANPNLSQTSSFTRV